MDSYEEKIRFAARYIGDRIGDSPKIGIVLGSGLSRISEGVEDSTVIQYIDIDGFPSSMVRGHRGEIICGTCEGKRVIMFNGRFHYYQGYPIQDVVLPVRVAGALGVERIIITNASGGINRSFGPGDIMLISDHINLLGTNPLIGRDTSEAGPIFVDMTQPYDANLIAGAKRVAKKLGIEEIREGVYLATAGPSYETKAEIEFFSRIGADAVGMSTVPEVIVANQLGMKVLGISVISNMACGISKEPLSHGEVLENVDRASLRLVLLVREIIGNVL